ncbi:MAG: DUF3047 domain-containing protein [Hyphomicrobiaceae bacterium]
MRVGIAAFVIGLVFASISNEAAADEVIAISRFSNSSLRDWESRSFKGETSYTFTTDPEIKSTVLKAAADASASGRFRKIKVDLNVTPFLNWSWKVTDIFPGIDERTKAGDDFPARIYVVVERGILGASSLSLNYVWASQHSAGSLWPSPYTNQVKLLAIDSGSEALSKWVRHKRDLRADLKKAFGEDITEVDAVALMTDTDDHGGRAETYYGEIWFSGK